MKTLLNTARNHVLNLLDVDGEQKLVPSTEVVLTFTEPKYAVIEGGKIAKYPDCETVRFHASAGSLRTLAMEFGQWADQLEEAFGECADDDEEADDEVDHVEVPEDEIGENSRVEAVSDEQIDEMLSEDEPAGPTVEELLATCDED